MNAEHQDVLSAFFDGESVDPSALIEALAEPDAASLLADFAALRAEAQRDLGRPSDRFYHGMSNKLRGGRVRWLWKRVRLPALAASLLFAAAAGGFLLRPTLAPSAPMVLMLQHPIAMPSVPAVRTTITPYDGDQRAAAGREGQRTLAGPPMPVLRLRFSQWQPVPIVKAGSED
jgi:hypothetical protein